MQAITNVHAQVTRQYWLSLLIRGIIAVLFGLAAILWPGLTVLLLVALFGVYAFIDGVVDVVAAFRESKTVPHWWLLLLEGLVGIIIGIVAFFWPSITALILLYLVAVWAIVTGIFEIGAVFSKDNRPLGMEWTLGAAGVISILLGIFLFLNPRGGLLGLVWAVGIYAIIFGILLLIRAFQFRPTDDGYNARERDRDRTGPRDRTPPMQEGSL
jgi:uncharacterized membrane protein HdeD (DUF308 family)